MTAQGDGGQLPAGWYYAAAGPLPGDTADPSFPTFGGVAAEFHQSQWAKDSRTAKSFGQLLTIAKWDTEILTADKPLTAASISAVAAAFKGPVPMGAPSLVCGTLPGAPAVCNDKVTFYQNTSPGVFNAVADWLGPPAGYRIPAADQ